MVDVFTKEKRSEIMSAVRHENTDIELKVRSILWRTGKRYRTHSKDVIGKPDIVNKRKKVAVFLDGCFWHGCPRCKKTPATNKKFWENKVKGNKKRRRNVKRKLKEEGWTVLEFWDCQINKDPEKVAFEIAEKL